MGYTSTFQVKNETEGNKLLRFLKDNLRTWKSVIGEEDKLEGYEVFKWALESNKPDGKSLLSYCHRKGHIGFDYGSGSRDEFHYAVLRWATKKIGVKRNGMARYLYDGNQWMNLPKTRYDNLGILKNIDDDSLLMQFWHPTTSLKDRLRSYRLKTAKENYELLRKEIIRLNELIRGD